MSIKAVILFLLVIVALGIVSGPAMRRLVAGVLGFRLPTLRPDAGQRLALRLGRAAGRRAARRGR